MPELLSDCCSRRLIENSDLCGFCLDHCGAYDEDDNEYEYPVNTWVIIPKIL